MSAFDGPYGLTNIELQPQNKVKINGELRVYAFDTHSGSSRQMIEVADSRSLRICDAFHRTGEDLHLAMQWMADLAGAVTGMEVEVPIYKEK